MQVLTAFPLVSGPLIPSFSQVPSCFVNLVGSGQILCQGNYACTAHYSVFLCCQKVLLLHLSVKTKTICSYKL
jgi:hypothetical protein